MQDVTVTAMYKQKQNFVIFAPKAGTAFSHQHFIHDFLFQVADELIEWLM